MEIEAEMSPSRFESDGQAMLQGVAAGAILQNKHLFTTCEIEQPQDDEGNYLPYFYVTLESGRYLVAVTKQTTIQERP